jgi:hypothetical protein
MRCFNIVAIEVQMWIRCGLLKELPFSHRLIEPKYISQVMSNRHQASWRLIFSFLIVINLTSRCSLMLAFAL